MVRKGVLYILFLLLSIVIYAQKPYIELIVEPSVVEARHPISVTIKTNTDGEMTMNFPDNFIQSGPTQSGMSSSMQYIRGKKRVVNFSYQTITGYFEDAGRYVMGPAKVKLRKGELSSDTRMIEVIQPKFMLSDDPRMNMSQVAFGIIQQSGKEVYEGEPVVLEGKVYSQVNILQIENYSPFTYTSSVTEHSLAGSGQVTVQYEQINGVKVQTFNIGKVVVFPDKLGDLTIRPFQTVVLYDNPRDIFPGQMKISSNETSIHVKPLPTGAPLDFIGAVGEFKMKSHFQSKEVNQGEVIEVKVNISGIGNLQNIEEPTLNLPDGFDLYGETEKKDSLGYSVNGVEGSKVFTYFVRAQVAGLHSFNDISISYFNPKTEKYERTSCKVGSIKVHKNEEYIAQKSNEIEFQNEFEMMPFMTSDSGGKKGSTLFSGWKGFLTLCSPLILGMLLGGSVRVRKNEEEKHRDDKKKLEIKQQLLKRLSDSTTLSTSMRANELSVILISFLANYFEVSNREITRSFITKEVGERLPKEVVVSITTVLDKLDAVQYGGFGDENEITQIQSNIESILNELAG